MYMPILFRDNYNGVHVSADAEKVCCSVFFNKVAGLG